MCGRVTSLSFVLGGGGGAYFFLDGGTLPHPYQARKPSRTLKESRIGRSSSAFADFRHLQHKLHTEILNQQWLFGAPVREAAMRPDRQSRGAS